MSYWREAATVIITSFSSKLQNPAFNYKVLCLKRSAASSFMPCTYVFPGGTVHAADSSNRWLKVFHNFNVEIKSKLNLAALPPILDNNADEEFPKYVAMKITAVRETFEETGILLCGENGKTQGKFASVVYHKDLQCWREEVEKDPYEFINLCESCNCYPDINNMYVWSNWLTPNSKKKRFDTLFFIASLPEIPITSADEKEITDIKWYSPNQLIQKNKEGSIKLAPPQIYEISRFLNFKDMSDLTSFAVSREAKGCVRWMPEYISTSNGDVGLLPGDEFYHANTFDGYGVPKRTFDGTKAQFHAKYRTLHRMDGNNIIIKNLQPANGHIHPVVLNHTPLI